MRNMSFFLTTTAMRNRTKTHTIRDGWRTLKPGDKIRAVVKTRGLRANESISILATLTVVSTSFRPLNTITQAEVIAEGFPTSTPAEFVAWFSIKTKCQPTYSLTFISFTFDN